ncbi:MAG TPA: D-arabinono-1,4-lactone oxidase, partial [Polyangiaceae bacterium]|nr:D-arabinono-1,4-lactone oxidase [Polyangiaceae bacterium]
PFQALSTRLVGLTFLLLGVNLWVAKNSRDQRAVSGYPLGAGVFALSLAAFSEWEKGAHAAALAWAGAGVALLVLGVRLCRAGKSEHGTPPRAHWEFWSPLFWVGLLTLVVGALLIALPGPVATFFQIEDPEARRRLQLVGAGFWVNTIAMWRAQYTRDTQVVSAQLWGSLAFDSSAPVLLAVAIADDLLNALGLLLLLPFLAIVASFTPLVGAVRARGRLAVEAPRTTEELARIVRDARRERRVVRALGSGHSVPGAIHGGVAPRPRPRRPSNEHIVHVSLDRLDRLVAVDRARARISVEAGMRIGVDPGHAASTQNNLAWYLRALGLALPDLGGIVHQTVGGFLATGSSGGSVQHSLHDSVVELRYIDGTGQLHVLRRDEPRERDQLSALLVSLGLLGIVTEVTFECEPAYRVRGRELTAPVTGNRAQIPAEEGGPPRREIVLDSPGAEGLAAYLSEQQYCRILWWPQPKLSSMMIWEAARAPLSDAAPVPYRPQQPWLQFLAGRVLDLLGWSYAPGDGGVIGRALRRLVLPPFARQFFPKKPIHFDDRWDINLPMDTHVDEAFLPVEFTELWFDIADTARVMAALLELYKDEELAGTFAVELYVAKASDAWLSPSHGRHAFRVDFFWYQNNHGDPVLDYYPAFWEKLARFSFRAHWGKHLPQPGSGQGAAYLTGQYPRWGDFAALRRQRDPDGVFLTTYWQRQLGIR